MKVNTKTFGRLSHQSLDGNVKNKKPTIDSFTKNCWSFVTVINNSDLKKESIVCFLYCKINHPFFSKYTVTRASLVAQLVQNPPAM